MGHDLLHPFHRALFRPVLIWHRLGRSAAMAEAGKQLAGLHIEPDGQLHSSFIWCLTSISRSRLPFSRLQKVHLTIFFTISHPTP